MYKLISFLILIASCVSTSAQDYPKNYFRSPMDIPLYLSGNFGELRTNHFHTGLDILTQGVEGKKIYAIADGYVSRINVSPWGYGKVIYVDHPNGFTSVYAHLSEYSPRLDSVYRQGQKHMKRSILDFYPDAGKIKVKKGEVIALSGNTGLSSGPHLHFEIRETKTEKPVNPLLFGFDIQDDKKPTLKGVRVYRFENDSAAGYNDQGYVVTGANGNYRLRDVQTISVKGTSTDKFGLAIHAVDYLTNSPGICGVYRIRLFLDDQLLFEQETEKLDFNTNRYMNAHTDYQVFRKYNQSYHRQFMLANNKLEIYKHHVNRGLFMIKDDIVHRVRYEVYDVYGNLSTLSFGLQRSNAPAMQEKKSDIMLNPNTENLVEKEQFQLFFPPGSVYHITPFTFSVSPEPQGAWSSLIRVHDEWTPVQKYFTVKIKSRVPERYKDKCVIAAYSNGRPGSNQNAIWQNGWVSADFRSFGSYAVMVDTVPPVITPINVANGKNMARNTEIAFKVQDNLSGTDNTELIIDGEWIPTEFNRRTDKYYAYFKDMGLAAGSHSVLFRAIDDRGNVSEWKGTIVR